MMIILLPVFTLLLLYYSIFLLKIITGLNKLEKPEDRKLPGEFISIIIPFRNESKNILASLKSIENLNYPEDKFEVIYVDDNSTDDSFNLLKTNISRGNITILKLPNEILSKGNKKRAVQFGIENSAGEIIITTDADCIHNKNWLESVLNYFDPQTAFVSAPVEFSDGFSFLSKLQKIEFEGLILAGAGLIGYGKPVICNGANIAYRKKVFQEAGGFGDNINLSSGDDEILMQKIAGMKKYNVKFCSEKDAVVLTYSSGNVKDFFNQRRRWASKGLFYPDKKLILQLLLIFLFYFGLILQPIFAFAGFTSLWLTFLLSVFIKVLLEYQIIKKGEKLFFNKNDKTIFLLAEFFQVSYIIISSLGGLVGNFTWKNRKVKR